MTSGLRVPLVEDDAEVRSVAQKVLASMWSGYSSGLLDEPHELRKRVQQKLQRYGAIGAGG